MRQKVKELSIEYLIGDSELLSNMETVAVKAPFSDEILTFFNALSKKMLSIPEARQYPDVITLAFWLRRSHFLKEKELFETEGGLCMGRGTVFHIAPSNVPVNYFYSFATGLICGNANIVRLPSKDFPQVMIINQAVKEVLEEFKTLKDYICFIRYGHEQEINDVLSAVSDVRVIWGGDATVKEVRNSALRPRGTEVVFADRYSLCVVDADKYLDIEDKKQVASDFYNDTYLTDQNACTSPRIVIWTGKQRESAKELFWDELHNLAEQKYTYQDIQGVNKLDSLYCLGAENEDVHLIEGKDNLLVRVRVESLKKELLKNMENSGYFLEYDSDDLMELTDLCEQKCQTISYIGETKELRKLAESGVRGIDRIVPVGKTMDFSFVWDGYDLLERLTRRISIV